MVAPKCHVPILSALGRKKFVEHRSTKKVIGADVDPPQVDNAHSGYANAFEFEPHDFATGEFSPPKFFPQSDLQHRVASRWALPQISSFYFEQQCV